MVKTRKYPTEDLKYLVFTKTCMDCGKKSDVRIRFKDGKIMDGVRYYGKMTFGLGNWGKYKWDGEKPDGTPNWKRCISYQKELWYRLIDFKRRLLHQYTEAEMWSCQRCSKKDREHWRREQKKNEQHKTGSETIPSQ